MFQRYATAAVLSVERGPKLLVTIPKLGDPNYAKVSHRHRFQYTPRPGFIYVRSRAISSRCNENFDDFPAEEIEKGYRSFIGKPAFVNHANHDHRRARGVIIDAALHKDSLNGRPDWWVELLHEVDAKAFPKLAEELINGNIARTSMGTDVEYSLCSVCGNKATSPAEYCQHLPKMKGKIFQRVTASGTKEDILCREICYGLRFFENSFLVEDPADPTAHVLGVDTNGLTLAANRTVSNGTWTGINTHTPTNWVVSGNTISSDLVDRRRAAVEPIFAEAGEQPPWLKDDKGDSNSESSDYPSKDDDDDDPTDDTSDTESGSDSDAEPEHERDDEAGGSGDDAADDSDDSDTSDSDADSSDGGGDGDGGNGSSGGSSSHSAAVAPQGHSDLPHEPSDDQRAWHGIWQGLMDTMDAHGESDDERIERQGQMHDGLSKLYAGGKGVIDHDDHGDPYYEVRHTSGWSARHYGGPYAHIHHDATGEDVHDLHPIAHDVDGDGKPDLPEDWGHKHLQKALGDWHKSVGGAYDHLLPPHARSAQRNRTQFRATVDESAAASGIAQLAEKGDTPSAATNDSAVLQRVARLHDPKPLPALVPHKPVRDMAPEEKTAWNRKVKEHGDQFAKQNPIHHQNIIDHWHAATPEEKEAGKSWYRDAHHTAKHIAQDTGTDMHTMAGLVANYSPQTHWAANVVNAAKVARTKKGLGGPGSGVMATSRQRDIADRLIGGESHHHLLTGQKIGAFAHLIEHGGDSEEDKAQGKQRVCVDRHAYSVATGARASDAAYAHSRLGTKKRYGEAEDAYRTAAKHISEHEGEDIPAHAVQATTWLARQRLNEEHDRKTISGGARTAANARKTIEHMHAYFGEHHPEASLQMPGTGYSKNNEPNKLEKLSFGIVASYDLTVEAATEVAAVEAPEPELRTAASIGEEFGPPEEDAADWTALLRSMGALG